MTKIYKSILGLSLLLLGVKTNAQVAPYAFTQTSGVYSAITGGTIYGTTATDDDVFVDPANPIGDPSGSQGVGIPIGFNFNFNGSTYDVIGIDNNGWISFGQSVLAPSAVDMNTNSYAAVISNASFALPVLQNRVAALNRDLQAQPGSSVRVELLGASPNQTLVIQWENYRRFNSTTDNFNFQIRLNQTTDIVEVVYGSFTTTDPFTYGVQVGLRGSSNMDYNNRDVTSPNIWATSIAGAANTAVANFDMTLTPSSGQIYRWTPPAACSGVPNAGTVSASQTICPNTTAVVSNTSSNAFTGIVYQWMESPSPTGPWTNVTTGSGFNTPVLTTAALSSLTYYQLVITCTNTSQSATTAVTSVNPNNPPTLCYCNTNLGGSGCFGDNITNVSILNTPLNNNSTCNNSPIFGTYTQFNPGPTTTATLNIGITYTISVTTTANNIESVWIDYDQSGTFDISEHTQISLTSVPNVATLANITIPGTALLGQTGMRVRTRGTGNPNGPPDACSNFGSGETEDYIVTIAAATPCAGAPGANSAVASLTSICPSGSVSLSLANTYTVGGLTYQWFSAPAVSGPYTSIASGTTAIYTATNLTANTFYQVVITCTNGPASTTSTPVQVVVSGNPCQCAAYCPSSANNTGDDEIFNVTIGTLNNTSNCTQTGGPGSILNRYSNYTGMMAAPNLTVANNYTLDVTVGQCGSFAYSGGVTVYIDYNQNGSFTDPGEQVFVGPNTTWAVAGTLNTTVITIPANATPGITRMRVIAAESNVGIGSCVNYGWGETEDYCVNIAPGTPCAGAPAANSAIASATNVCPGGSSNLGLATSYTVGGLTYQWYTSPVASGPYTAVSGATTSVYSFTNITTALYYQAVITCTNGPASTTSTPVQILVGGSPCQCAAYCTSNALNTFDDEIFNVSIGTLNNTSNCSQTGSAPTSTLNLYSNYTGIIAAPNLAAGLNYTLSMTAGQCNSTAWSGIITAYMDFNQNGSFGDPGELVYTSPYGPFAVTGTTFTTVVTIPPNSTLGTTRLRVIAAEQSTPMGDCGTYFYGETEDYCINITAPTPCAGAPGANTAVTSATNVCPNGSANLTLATSYTVGGLTYQWFSAPAVSGPYTAISGATLSSHSATNLTTSLYYYAVITCTNGPASTTSTPVQIQVGGSSCQCAAYCTSEANSVNDDEIFNVTIGTLNNTTNCSQTGGPGSILNRYSNYAGMIAAPNIQQSGTYTLDVTVGQCGSFAYTGGVTVYMDFDQNGSFADPGEQVFVGPSTTWAIAGTLNSTVITIPSTALLGITRMRVIAEEGTVGSPDCGNYGWGETEDYCINITPSCAVPNLTLTASQTTICSGNSATLTATGATTYTWNTTAITSSITVSPSTTTSYTVTGENTPGCPDMETITINVNPVPTLSVSTSPTVCPGITATLSATSDANTYNWTPGSYTTAVISVTPAISTVYNVVTTNSLGCSTNSNVTVYVVVCTGLAKNTVIDNSTFVYPNPNNGNINVVIASASGSYVFEVYDLSGRVVYKATLTKAESALSIKELANGMYTYKITSTTTKVAIKEGKLIKE